MFKIFKYLLLSKVFEREKKRIIFVFCGICLLIVFPMIINDLIIYKIVDIKIALMIKWGLILSLLFGITLSLYKIFATLFSFMEFPKENISKEEKVKKEEIFKKDKLLSKSDNIYQKYKGVK